VLLDNADTDERATERVVGGLREGEKLPPDERFRPFHTDELRKQLVVWPIRFSDK